MTSISRFAGSGAPSGAENQLGRYPGAPRKAALPQLPYAAPSALVGRFMLGRANGRLRHWTLNVGRWILGVTDHGTSTPRPGSKLVGKLPTRMAPAWEDVMFNNLIESSSHGREFRRRGSFLLFTTMSYALLFVIAGVISIYAYDARMDDQNLELVTLMPLVDLPAPDTSSASSNHQSYQLDGPTTIETTSSARSRWLM